MPASPLAQPKRVRPASSHSRRPQAPREHGFWVLLSLSVGAALIKAPGWLPLAVAAATVLFTIIGAIVIGKRIRKNPILQAAASVLIAFTSVPVLLAGGASPLEAAHFALPLGLAFLSGTFCVRAIFERARKAPARARIAAASSIALPTLAAFALLSVGVTASALALGVTALYALLLAAISPTAKRLRAVGLSISFAHLGSALLLAF